MLTARQSGKLCGYLIQHMNGEDCTVEDLLAEDDAARSTLLAEATTWPANAISYPQRALALHPPRPAASRKSVVSVRANAVPWYC